MDLNKKHLLYLTVFFLFLSLNASGQSNSISGRVLNQNTKESVEYASVVLFKQDSVFLNGTTADSIGRFVFTNLTSDDYVLSVSCMGFEAKKILLQNLSESAEIDVLLNESVLSLGEIVISASSTINKGEFYQFNLSSCIRQQNSLTAQFVSFSLANLANIFYPPRFLQ